ncbi:hypothetical protein V6R21_08010 [Limibacter armeniacum]|uniref:hypothetical protein n=1 Tax=Limibacter armeniacum TaxID=466084 RepID=UPI002FE63909
MKRLLFILLVFVVFQSCAQSIDLNDLKISDRDFKVTYWKKDSAGLDSTITSVINKDSKELKSLTDWLINNSTGWGNSIASFASPNISLTSGNLRFLIFKDFVVIGYSDKNNKSRQLTKKVDIKEFGFLIE